MRYALFAGAALWAGLACAERLPEDARKIETLTPPQAGELIARFKGKWLYLDGLVALDADTAKRLAEFRGDVLDLRGLTTVDADTAEALAQFRGHRLVLNGLTTLDASTAKAFAEFGGRELTLTGLTAIDAGSATALAPYLGHLEIPADVVKRFVAAHPVSRDTALAHARLRRGDLTSLTKLDAGTAKALAAFQGDSLWLNGLTTIDADTARALAMFKGQHLSFGVRIKLGTGSAKALAAFSGTVAFEDLQGLKRLPFKPLPFTRRTALRYAEARGGTLDDSQHWTAQTRSPSPEPLPAAKARCGFPT
jgi:hypothetical protein